MTEQMLQIVAVLKIIALAGFSLLYGWGGMHGKWKRRIVGAIYLTLILVGFSLWQKSMSYWYFLYAPLLWGALSIGYGGDEMKEKIVKRGRYGLALGIASLPIAILNMTWLLFGLHIFLCTLVSVILGVYNPVEAREEETIIGTVGGFLPLYMI